MEKIRPIDGGESAYCLRPGDEDNKMGYLLFTP